VTFPTAMATPQARMSTPSIVTLGEARGIPEMFTATDTFEIVVFVMARSLVLKY
jgi:hypothetical protein